MRSALVSLIPAALLACGGAAARPPAAPAAPAAAAPAPPAPPTPPALRLPRTLLPDENRVSLVLDPARSTFTGRIEIAAHVAQPARVFWLNAEALAIDEATLRAGAETMALEVLPQEHDFVGLRAPREIAAGPVTVTLRYHGKVDVKETEGIFRQKAGDDWYLFTQFEATGARRAFPCFDEPDSKVPWQIALDVPQGTVAISNTPVAADEKTDHGTRRVTFAKTRPLPSYLVAFAVGRFEIVPAGKTRKGIPIRIVVPHGHAGEVAYVAETTAPILALLEDYFGMPYPFAKLDLLAIPLTVGFGAMENPGLVTFNQHLLVARRTDFTIDFQRRFAAVAAHELAHQWFGDLVTLAWWNDTWLNEAFASWMANKVIEEWKPEWSRGVRRGRAQALQADSLATAREIRQPIETKDDIESSFDPITYGKGAAVLAMFERWIGEEPFRAGVRAYLEHHAWKNATTADFLSAVSKAAGRDVDAPMSTFLDQAGVPLVSFALDCKPGRPPRLSLAQERYLPRGSRASAHETWQVPVCVRYAARGGTGRACTLLTEAHGELPLPHASSCPAWVLGNENGMGYYHSAFEGSLLKHLLNRGLKKISPAERVAAIGDVEALVFAGKVDLGMALGLVPRFAGDRERHVVSAVAAIAENIDVLVPDALRGRYQRFIERTFGARARKLGWTPNPNEGDDTRLLRKTVVDMVANLGEDKALVAAAHKLALAWLDDHGSVDPDMAQLVLTTAAHHGDRELFDRFLAEAKKAKDRRDREMLLAALGGFRDPALVARAVALLTSGDFDMRESMRPLFSGLGDRRTRRVIYDEVKAHYDEIAGKMPRMARPYLVYTGVAQCDRALKRDVEAFFKDRTAKAFGGALVYKQAMEQMDLCIRYSEAVRPAVAAFLKRW